MSKETIAFFSSSVSEMYFDIKSNNKSCVVLCCYCRLFGPFKYSIVMMLESMLHNVSVCGVALAKNRNQNPPDSAMAYTDCYALAAFNLNQNFIVSLFCLSLAVKSMLSSVSSTLLSP